MQYDTYDTPLTILRLLFLLLLFSYVSLRTPCLYYYHHCCLTYHCWPYLAWLLSLSYTRYCSYYCCRWMLLIMNILSLAHVYMRMWICVIRITTFTPIQSTLLSLLPTPFCYHCCCITIPRIAVILARFPKTTLTFNLATSGWRPFTHLQISRNLSSAP